MVTYNVRDFDGEVLRQHEVAVVTPPELVERLLDDEPSVVALALRAMAERKKRPPMSAAEVAAAVARQQGFGALAESLRLLAD